MRLIETSCHIDLLEIQNLIVHTFLVKCKISWISRDPNRTAQWFLVYQTRFLIENKNLGALDLKP